MQMVSLETICMKCQILFSGKNKKNIISLSSAEFAHSIATVKTSSRYSVCFVAAVLKM